MKYFGTDGIRGEYGVEPINDIILSRLADAIEVVFKPDTIILGRDTRDSGKKIFEIFVNSFSGNIKVIDIGVVTSPLLSKSVVDMKGDFGIMITASHNCASDNGVKIFNKFGEKISIEMEIELEKHINAQNVKTKKGVPTIESVKINENYIVEKSIFEKFPKVIIDCANGSVVEFAKKSYLFPEVIWVGNDPNGSNINDNCGSEHPELLTEKVKTEGADLGIAHDGDGDRVLLCDQFGNILPGEVILGVIAIYLKEIRCLKENKIVTTAMSNSGLKYSLSKYDIQVEEANVGDRNVVEMMKKFGCNLGGESSGHIIFFDSAPTSDGIKTALLFLQAITFLKINLSQAINLIQIFPKKLYNIQVKNKLPLENIDGFWTSVYEDEEVKNFSKKTFIRYSGTENKLRILVEAETEVYAENILNKIKKIVANCKKII